MKHVYLFYLRRIYLMHLAWFVPVLGACLVVANQIELPPGLITTVVGCFTVFHIVRVMQYGIASQFVWLSQQGIGRFKLVMCSFLFLPPILFSGLLGYTTMNLAAEYNKKFHLDAAEKHESAPVSSKEHGSDRVTIIALTIFPMLLPLMGWWIFGGRVPAPIREPIRANWYDPRRSRFFRLVLLAVLFAIMALELFGPIEGEARGYTYFAIMLLLSGFVAWFGTALVRENFVLSRRSARKLRMIAYPAHALYLAFLIFMYVTATSKPMTDQNAGVDESSTEFSLHK